MTTEYISRFKPGDRVRVKVGSPPGHVRTPAYIQGKTGWVEVLYGTYGNPERLTYGSKGLPMQALYRVAFRQLDVWEGRYSGTLDDTICVDLYDHWLEPP